MKHVMYSDKSLFVDDETADLVLAYADALGNAGASDTIRIPAIGTDGNEVQVSMLLNGAAQIVIETTNSSAAAPRDEKAIEYLSTRLRGLSEAPHSSAHELDPAELRRIEFDDLP